MNSLNPLSPLWESVIGLRNWIYDNKVIESVKLPIPVISVGNITMGGTGKTPIIQWLLTELKKLDYHPGVVSRNYGAHQNKSGLVTLGHDAASKFGDEAVLLKMNNPDVPIFSGPLKWKSALNILEEAKGVDVLLVDDGFQHRKLHRNFDIVLLDCSVDKKDYSWPPMGRARESLKALQRADVLIVTKSEQSNSETLSFLEREFMKLNKQHNVKSSSLVDYSQEPNQRLVLRSEQKQGFPQWVRGRPLPSQNTLLEGKGMSFCGLGNPKSFFISLKKQGLKVSESKVFPDHFQYDKHAMDSLVKLSDSYDYFVTSEKDFVKLLDWPKDGPPLCIVSLEHQLSGDMEGFRAKLVRHLWKNH